MTLPKKEKKRKEKSKVFFQIFTSEFERFIFFLQSLEFKEALPVVFRLTWSDFWAVPQGHGQHPGCPPCLEMNGDQPASWVSKHLA